ncbi:MAG: hypothetical protein ABI855_18240 [Bacteroidota bacterium]
MAGEKSKPPGQKKKQPVLIQPGKKEEKSFSLLIYALPVLVITFICFIPCIKNGLTNWDDPTYLTNNPLIRSLSVENIKRIITEVPHPIFSAYISFARACRVNYIYEIRKYTMMCLNLKNKSLPVLTGRLSEK